VGRWAPGAGSRLERAALELYLERGFDETTVAEIAARAGLTERTFFRHFADKREVLFSGAAELQSLLVGAVARAPHDVAPLDVVLGALGEAAAFLEARRPFARQRHDVISATPELEERELRKLAALATAISEALNGRGVSEPRAALTAELGVALFKVAFERWVTSPEGPPLGARLVDAAEELRSVTAR
jgi:AcrR family transcriptional regulator